MFYRTDRPKERHRNLVLLSMRIDQRSSYVEEHCNVDR